MINLIWMSQINNIAIKSSTMVGENFEIHLSQMPRIPLKSPTMVGENFEIDLFQMSKIAFKIIQHCWRNT